MGTIEKLLKDQRGQVFIKTTKNNDLIDTIKGSWKKNYKQVLRNDNLINEIKKNIKKARIQSSYFDISAVNPEYSISVSDATVKNPFIINLDLVKIINNHTKNCKSDHDKAYSIYGWVEDNIDYGVLKQNNGYRNSKEVLELREGVCGEMAFLYITMTRSINLKSNYVSVNVDCLGERVRHACASVHINRRVILVDPAYHKFDIKHREYEILTDKEAILRYQQWRLR